MLQPDNVVFHLVQGMLKIILMHLLTFSTLVFPGYVRNREPLKNNFACGGLQ